MLLIYLMSQTLSNLPMKNKSVCIALFLIVCLAYVGLVSYSDGVAATANVDRTGSPVGGGQTCACHNGGSFNASVAITMKDTLGNMVFEYDPGVRYIIEIVVSAAMGSPGGYGVQALSILSDNTQAGGFSGVTTPNTKITSAGNHQYIEHDGVGNGGIYSCSWTAPARGSGDVVFYASGVVVNFTGTTQGDQPTSSVNLTLTEMPPTTITYTGSYCLKGASPAPTINGKTGGYFKASSNAVTLDSLSGVIDLENTFAGTHTIWYILGTNVGDTASTDVTFNPVSSANFNFGTGGYCYGDVVENPTTQNPGGSFASIETGLLINQLNGQIDVNNSAPGLYNVTYATTGLCPDMDTVQLGISHLTLDTVSLDHVSCANDLSGQVVVAATNGGFPYQYTWSTGDSLDTLSGVRAGDYEAYVQDTYGCKDTVKATLEIQDTMSLTAVVAAIESWQDKKGEIDISVSGGEEPYSFNWTGPENFASSDEDIDSLSEVGEYTIVITDANGCAIDSAFIVNGTLSIWSEGRQNLISIYPVPNNGSFSLMASNMGKPFDVQILNVSGAEVYRKSGLSTGQHNFQIELNTGVYLLKISEFHFQQRIIVE